MHFFFNSMQSGPSVIIMLNHGKHEDFVSLGPLWNLSIEDCFYREQILEASTNLLSFYIIKAYICIIPIFMTPLSGFTSHKITPDKKPRWICLFHCDFRV